MKKSADILGIGQDSVIAIPTDENNKIDCQNCQRMSSLLSKTLKVLAIVGVAGTTETGNVDPLNEMADIAQQYQCHFHVDAAWGGATLLSNKYRSLMARY